jgi:glucokinase
VTELLADIGGTHARIAQADVVAPEKYAVAGFDAIEAVIARYCREKSLEEKGTIRIATAANPGADGLWRFTNNPGMVIDPAALKEAGWELALLADDFVASAHGVPALPKEKRIALRQGTPMPGAPYALLGPGTGLGLAYMIKLPGKNGGGWHVQQTFGGHMLAAAATEEQREILDIVADLKADGTIPVPEDVASGRGLPLLYKAVCRRDGAALLLDSAAGILGLPGDAQARKTLRLFHEFLGLFAHHVLVTGHAYGGLYLDGGVIHGLRRSGLFDFAQFEKFMQIRAVPTVREAVAATPVWLVDDPYVALRGLMEMAR